MDERKALLRKVQREYENAEKVLQRLKLEVIKAIQGTSAFALDLLNSLIQETKQQCQALKESYLTAQIAAEENEELLHSLTLQYDQLIAV